MNKKLSLLLVLIIAVVFAGAGYYMGTRDNVFSVTAVSEDGMTTQKSLETEMMSESMQFIEVVGKISPEKYKDIKQKLGNYDTMTREQKLAWMNEIAGLTAVLLVDRISYASDDALNAFAAAVKEQAEGYLVKDPSGQQCFNNFFPGLNKFPQNKSQFTYNEADIRMLKTVNLILISSLEDRNTSEVPAKEAYQVLGNIYQKLTDKYGDKVELLTNLNEGAKDPVTTCHLVGDFYDYFMQEPNKVASAEALRLILSQ
ncbi:hypothetical protein CKG00_00825 [Morganella morganii]|uniref:Uncharacterized protein n=1 Tax=Morganella morganii TaxID=582 RepID=A0A433ZSK5_MORMO|nr:hypothetical protein [Morganella morganii]RUT65105.1 hypothetical protein CKG00_00825 [Morganella morganii]